MYITWVNRGTEKAQATGRYELDYGNSKQSERGGMYRFLPELSNLYVHLSGQNYPSETGLRDMSAYELQSYIKEVEGCDQKYTARRLGADKCYIPIVFGEGGALFHNPSIHMTSGVKVKETGREAEIYCDLKEGLQAGSDVYITMFSIGECALRLSTNGDMKLVL